VRNPENDPTSAPRRGARVDHRARQYSSGAGIEGRWAMLAERIEGMAGFSSGTFTSAQYLKATASVFLAQKHMRMPWPTISGFYSVLQHELANV